MSDEKCLFCVPLNTGVKIIAGFQLVALIGLFAVGLLYPSMLILTMPMIFLYMIICVGFFFESCYRSTKARKNLLLAYILLIVLTRNIYYLVMIVNDRLPNEYCAQKVDASLD